MMRSELLERQLSEYGRQLDAQIVTLERADVQQLAPKPPARRGWLIAVSAAVVTMVVLGGVAWFAPFGSDTPTAQELTVVTTLPEQVTVPEPETLTDTTVSTTTLTTVATPVVTGWSRVSDDDGVFGGPGGQEMHDVIVAGPGFVAVGFDGGDAAVWTSVDGSVWSRVPHDETVFGNVGIGGVTTDGNVIVAVGGYDALHAPDRSFAIVWTSPDGLSWTRVVDDENVFSDAGMSDVTVGGPGFVAVGSTDGDPEDQGSDAVVWTSVDGQSWSKVAHDDTVFGGVEPQGMNSVTVGGPGLVAVGYDHFSAAVWTSADGVVWSRVPDDGSVFLGDHHYMASVTAGGPGLVAVGWGGTRPVWTSVDGLVWSRIPRDVPRGASSWMSSVIVDGERLVAVGPGGSWSSVDGITWTLMPDVQSTDGDRTIMTTVVASDVGLVAVGSVGVEPDPGLQHDAAVWLQK